MSSLDYIKKVTERVTTYIDQPKSSKEKKKDEEIEEVPRPFYNNRWFGTIPYSVKSYFKNKK